MAASSRSAREAKRRIQQMEAKRELRREQDKRREARQRLAAGAGTAAVPLAVVPPAHRLRRKPHRRGIAAAGRRPRPGTPPPLPAPSPPPRSNAATSPSRKPPPARRSPASLTLNRGTLGVELDGTKAPRRPPSSSPWRTELLRRPSCHRLTTAKSFGVLQCGSKAGDGSGDPDTRGARWKTPRGQHLPGRHHRRRPAGANAYGNGTQFFIVYKDTDRSRRTTGGYTVVGKVTAGLDVVTEIAAGRPEAGAAAPRTAHLRIPVTIDSFSLK